MNEITFISIVKIVVLKPTKELDILLKQEKYKYVNLFPVLYGVIIGVSKFFNEAALKGHIHAAEDLAGTVVPAVFFAALLCFVYSWVVMLISNSLEGNANLNMTTGLISYSMIPMIIGALLFLVFNVLIFISDSIHHWVAPVYSFVHYGQHFFVLWSLFILVPGNAFINGFSISKSFICSAALILLLDVLVILVK